MIVIVIRDAVLREMERGGQLYYLYNKVDTVIIERFQITGDLVPELRLGMFMDK